MKSDHIFSYSPSKILRVSTCGSLMLFGEHAVLRGNHAMVATIDKKLTVELTSRQDNKLKIISDLGEYESHINELKEDIKIIPPFQFILTTLLILKTEYGSLLSGLSNSLALSGQEEDFFKQGLTLKITSDFSDKIGFGSSAAVVAATIAGISVWRGLDFTEEDVFHLGKKIIETVQGVASGADMAAAVYGGTILYRRDPLLIKKIWKLPPLVAVYSGYKTPTSDVIQMVKKRFTGYDAHLKNIDAAMENCTLQALQALQEENWPGFGFCMNVQQGFLNTLGVSDSFLERIIFRLREDKGVLGAKISGSGLGDCVIATGKLYETNEKDFKVLLKTDTVKIIPIQTGLQGLCVEHLDE